MTRPLPKDLRERLVNATEAGESRRAVAARLGIAISSVAKWSQRYRMCGSFDHGKIGGHRKRLLEPYSAFILERVSQTPRPSVHALQTELAARGVKVSQDTVWRFIRREYMNADSSD